jgi:hypothetical protein
MYFSINKQSVCMGDRLTAMEWLLELMVGGKFTNVRGETGYPHFKGRRAAKPRRMEMTERRRGFGNW